jgi:Ser/Thr protein kinase RdoA (MazF antagonist)
MGAMQAPHPYAQLTPDTVLGALEARGLRCDGRLLALNSYENRVYQVGVEEATPVVAKFYRPGRWSDAQIDEEHAFARELAEREVPVVAPMHSLRHADFRVAVYPRRGGRTPDLDNPKTLEWTGRFIARIHAVGATKPFQHRETLNQKTFGHDQRAYLLKHDFIPADLLDKVGRDAVTRRDDIELEVQ